MADRAITEIEVSVRNEAEAAAAAAPRWMAEMKAAALR